MNKSKNLLWLTFRMVMQAVKAVKTALEVVQACLESPEVVMAMVVALDVPVAGAVSSGQFQDVN